MIARAWGDTLIETQCLPGLDGLRMTPRLIEMSDSYSIFHQMFTLTDTRGFTGPDGLHLTPRLIKRFASYSTSRPALNNEAPFAAH